MIALYWLWRFGMFLTSRVPPRWSLRAAYAMGSGAYYTMPLRRRIARENFARVLGKPPNAPEVGRVARRAFQNYVRYLRDVMLYPRIPTSELERRVVFHNMERLSEALALNKGAIIVSAHFGNMDMPSAVIAKRWKPLTLVAESVRPPQLMDYLTRMREARHVHLYPYDLAPRKILQALKRGEMTGFLLDFGVTHHLDITTVLVDFFGTPTPFPAGPAQVALITGSPIVVGFTYVQADGIIHAHATPPIRAVRTGNRRRDMQVIMQEIAARFEGFIRQHPDQWYIFRPMWRKETDDGLQMTSASLPDQQTDAG